MNLKILRPCKASGFFKRISLLVFVFIFNSLQAQNHSGSITYSPVNLAIDSVNSKIDVQFNCETLIYNVLVLLTDNHSNTLFLDNQYSYNGIYHRIIDLKGSPDGIYYLNIIRDEDNILKIITSKK